MRGVATPADRAVEVGTESQSASSTGENDRFTAQLPESGPHRASPKCDRPGRMQMNS